MEIVLYTTGCPKCIVLEKKLKLKNIEYVIVNNQDEIKSMGFLSLPVLKVNNKPMTFTEAISWVNEVNV